MLTVFYARFLGVWVLLTVLSMLAEKDATVATMNAFFADPALMWITGVFTLGLGVAIVVSHNRWSGGAMPVLVTLYGWIALLKGLTFVCLPPATETALYQSLHFAQYYYAYFVISLALGGYLTYSGFRRNPQ